MKTWLMMSNKELDKYSSYLDPYIDSIYMRSLDDDPLTKDQVKQIIDYDGFSSCIKYNRLTELWDLPYSYALESIRQYQTKYLRTPLYVVFDDGEIYHLETGIEEFWSRFKIKKEDQ